MAGYSAHLFALMVSTSDCQSSLLGLSSKVLACGRHSQKPAWLQQHMPFGSIHRQQLPLQIDGPHDRPPHAARWHVAAPDQLASMWLVKAHVSAQADGCTHGHAALSPPARPSSACS
jgi:hypothetical protein